MKQLPRQLGGALTRLMCMSADCTFDCEQWLNAQSQAENGPDQPRVVLGRQAGLAAAREPSSHCRRSWTQGRAAARCKTSARAATPCSTSPALQPSERNLRMDDRSEVSFATLREREALSLRGEFPRRRLRPPRASLTNGTLSARSGGVRRCRCRPCSPAAARASR